jgi:multisubunit Na+/H+ antiporter MnhB subunit
MLELYLLLVFMIIGAVIALEVKDMVSAVIAVGAVGMGVSLAFLVLKAPDLAITQLTVEILMLIILIRLTLRSDLPFSTSGRWLLNTVITLLFIAVFLGVAYVAIKEIPQFGSPLMKVAKVYVADGLGKTGAANLVSSVILDFRAYDTLGEATVLFTAVIGVMSVLRRVGRKKEGKDPEEGDE